MAKVVGVGGIFFKSPDPAALMAFYEKALGFPAADGCVTFPWAQVPKDGYTVWSPFQANTEYFQPSSASFMINLAVDDLVGALEQVRAAGGEVVGEIEQYDYGQFGWFLDPDGNKVELWQPA
ncbi:MAG: VOC family protein [Xanthomonadales bacterium]|nr:VOC family protein [Xanthomonadales bacterium]